MILRICRSSWRHVFIALLLLTLSVLIGNGSASAFTSMKDPAPTVVRIYPIAPIYAGQPFVVSGLLYRHVTNGTEGIPNRSVELYLEPLQPKGAAPSVLRIAAVHSDAQGNLQWNVRNLLSAGRYRVYFLFRGTGTLQNSFATTELEVTEAEAVVLQVFSPPPMSPSESVTITARLTTANRLPLVKRRLFLQLPGVGVTEQRDTNAKGVATFIVNKPLPVGITVGKVRYAGEILHRSASAVVQLSVKAPQPTELQFLATPNTEFFVGDELPFSARLQSQSQPLANRFVRFYLGGQFRYGAWTDSEGKATLRLPRDLTFGTYGISVTFQGAKNFADATAARTIQLLPRPFEIHTVPPLPNVTLLVGEERITTDIRGIARVQVGQHASVSVTVLPYTSPDPNVSAIFVRWSDNIISQTRRINLASSKVMQIGFELSHAVLPAFIVEHSGRPIDPTRLSQIVMVNNAGEVIQLTGKAQWLKANRIVRHDNALVSSPLSYQLRNALVDGVNVVNEGQQRFRSRRNARWSIKLQMHDLTISPRDALFGFPIGTGVLMMHPMGQFSDIPLDENGQLRVEALPRGNYTVTLQSAYILRNPMPVSLSRSQYVDLPVISFLDISVVVGMGLTVIVSAFLIGRSRILKRRQRRYRYA